MKTRSITLVMVLVVGMTAVVAAAQEQQVVETTSYLPQFETTKANVEALEENLAKTSKLAEILKKGNDELSEAVKQYRQDHSTETKDRIYTLLGTLAEKTVTQIDDIVANRDKIKDGLTEIIYKLDRIKTTLAEKKQKFDTYVENTRQQADSIKGKLRKLAKKIKSDSENSTLRKQFRSYLFQLQGIDKRYKTYQAHQRLNAKFAEQIGIAQQFFQRLDGNAEQLAANLMQQKEFLVMRIALLKDAAEMESWLRGESESNVSAFAMMKKIGELSGALEKFNAATDVLVEMNDIGTLIESLPDAGDIFGIDGSAGANGKNFEDKYVNYFLKN